MFNIAMSLKLFEAVYEYMPEEIVFQMQMIREEEILCLVAKTNDVVIATYTERDLIFDIKAALYEETSNFEGRNVSSGMSEYKVDRFYRLLEKENVSDVAYCKVVFNRHGQHHFFTDVDELRAVLKAGERILVEE